MPIPWFQASTCNRRSFDFSGMAGRYVVLSFLGSARRSDARRIVADVNANRASFNDEHCCFVGVTVDRDDVMGNRIQEHIPGVRYILDFKTAVSVGFGAMSPGLTHVDPLVDYRPFTLVLDERLRVLEQIPIEGDGAGHVERLIGIARSLPAIAPQREADIQAPVLVVPRVFEPELCRTLIELYQSAGGIESGFMRQEGDKTVGVYDYEVKRRRDHLIEDGALRNTCMARIRDCLLPEVFKAFQFKATRMERYIVACYEGAHGGHFTAHRDNTSKGTAHRRFAVTLNLNAEDYDGGYLWFPEFGRHRFKPPTGGAVVFSCSLLHEATPVTRGTRYVFLPFLYDDAAAAIRNDNVQFLGGNINSPPG